MVELFGAVLLLFGLSDLLFRFLGLGAYAHGSRREPKVALTFDDGPSERTEALLALLARVLEAREVGQLLAWRQRLQQPAHRVVRVQVGHVAQEAVCSDVKNEVLIGCFPASFSQIA